MKDDTRCKTCGHEFPAGKLKINKTGHKWGCPRCYSPLFEKIVDRKGPYKWGSINVKYEEGQHD